MSDSLARALLLLEESKKTLENAEKALDRLRGIRSEGASLSMDGAAGRAAGTFNAGNGTGGRTVASPEEEFEQALKNSMETVEEDELHRKSLETAEKLSRSPKKQEGASSKVQKINLLEWANVFDADDEVQVAIKNSFKPAARVPPRTIHSKGFRGLTIRKKFESLLEPQDETKWSDEMLDFYQENFPHEGDYAGSKGKDIDGDHDLFEEFNAYNAFYTFFKPIEPFDSKRTRKISLESVLDALMEFFDPKPDPMLSIDEYIETAVRFKGMITGDGTKTYSCKKIGTPSWNNSCLIFSIAIAAKLQHGIDAFPGMFTNDIRQEMSENFSKMMHVTILGCSTKLSLAVSIMDFETYDEQQANKVTWEKTAKRLKNKHFLDLQSFTSLYQDRHSKFPVNVITVIEVPLNKVMMEAAGGIIQFANILAVNELFNPGKPTVVISAIPNVHYSAMLLKKTDLDRLVNEYIADHKKAIPLANV